MLSFLVLMLFFFPLTECGPFYFRETSVICRGRSVWEILINGAALLWSIGLVIEKFSAEMTLKMCNTWFTATVS